MVFQAHRIGMDVCGKPLFANLVIFAPYNITIFKFSMKAENVFEFETASTSLCNSLSNVTMSSSYCTIWHKHLEAPIKTHGSEARGQETTKHTLN